MLNSYNLSYAHWVSFGKILLEKIAKPHPEFLTQEKQILFSFLWLIIATGSSDVRLGLICVSLATIFTSLFFVLYL